MVFSSERTQLSPLLEGVPSRADSGLWQEDGLHSGTDVLDTVLHDLHEEEDWSVMGPTTPGLTRARNRSYSESFVLGTVNNHKLERPIGWLAICFITFFNVSGGPWGSEEVFASVGPLIGLTGVATFGLCWALPMVMITSELSSAYPDDGGYSIWVAEAFGPFWGFQEAYWSWVSGVIDTAVYPVLAFDALVKVLGNVELSGTEAYLAKLGMALLFVAPNVVTSTMFGSWMMFLAAFVMLPFAVQCGYVAATRELDWSVLAETRADATYSDWVNLLAVLYWNFSGFDAVSTCAGEVRKPGSDYPKGLLLALFLVLLTYMAPLSFFAAVREPAWDTWEEGSFSMIAKQQGGQWLAVWVILSSFAANSGMYSAEVFEDSWQLCGMARTGLMPSVFGKRYGENGPPLVAISFAMLVIACLIALDFDAIVAITNLFSCLSSLLEQLAFLKLRLVEPHLPRPFRVPIRSIRVLTVMSIMPMAVGSFVLASSMLSSYTASLINTVALSLGFALFAYMERSGTIRYQRDATAAH